MFSDIVRINHDCRPRFVWSFKGNFVKYPFHDGLQTARAELEDARVLAQQAQERAAYAEGAGVETQRRADLLQVEGLGFKV